MAEEPQNEAAAVALVPADSWLLVEPPNVLHRVVGKVQVVAKPRDDMSFSKRSLADLLNDKLFSGKDEKRHQVFTLGKNDNWRHVAPPDEPSAWLRDAAQEKTIVTIQERGDAVVAASAAAAAAVALAQQQQSALAWAPRCAAALPLGWPPARSPSAPP